MDRSAPPVDLLLITGPLGAGKTTVVNALLKQSLEEGHRISLLINEFGAVSVDEVLIAAQRPELADIASLVNGCACCSLRSEVVAILAAWCELPAEHRPQRVLLETTGLADPTDLVDLETEPALAGKLRLAGCLTVVSALTPLHHLTQRELVRHQVALASLLYVSKVDLDPSQAMAVESELRCAHPDLAIVPSRLGIPAQGSADPWKGERPKPTESHASLPRHGYRDARVVSHSWRGPIDPEGLERLFRMPGPPGHVLRAKGVAAFQGWPLREDGSDRWAFQLADGRLEILPLPLRPDGTPVPMVAVVIGRNLHREAWEEALAALE
ncbi:MAG: GTP-binding protein [Firmicutes bacterium]|nr:GTP-binding protein [Bacillota bacterium]